MQFNGSQRRSISLMRRSNIAIESACLWIAADTFHEAVVNTITPLMKIPIGISVFSVKKVAPPAEMVAIVVIVAFIGSTIILHYPTRFGSVPGRETAS
jgi:hypothetical protein